MGFENENAPINESFTPAYRATLRLFPPQEDYCEFTIACRRDNYSASAIARAVEDANAHLLNLNITSDDLGPSDLAVALRVNHRDVSAVERSLLRYGYEIIAIHSGTNANRQEAIDNLNALFNNHLQ